MVFSCTLYFTTTGRSIELYHPLNQSVVQKKVGDRYFSVFAEIETCRMKTTCTNSFFFLRYKLKSKWSKCLLKNRCSLQLCFDDFCILISEIYNLLDLSLRRHLHLLCFFAHWKTRTYSPIQLQTKDNRSDFSHTSENYWWVSFMHALQNYSILIKSCFQVDHKIAWNSSSSLKSWEQKVFDFYLLINGLIK